MDKPRIYKDADSRLQGFFGQVTHPTMPMQRTYCFMCKKPWGYSSMDSSANVSPAQVLVTCDDCDMNLLEKYGSLPLEQVPTDLLDAFGIIPETKEK